MVDTVQQQLGAFLRSLDEAQFRRFCHMIRLPTPDLNDGLWSSWEQWKDYQSISIVATKQNNPSYYESVVLPAFPSNREGQELLRYMLALKDTDLLDFYRAIMDKTVVLHVAQRPQLTLEILDAKQMDPARWVKAKRRAGIGVAIHKPLEASQAANTESIPPASAALPSTTGASEVAPQSRPWSRNEKIGLISALAAVVAAVAAVLGIWGC